MEIIPVHVNHRLVCSMVLQAGAGCYRLLQGVIQCDKVLHRVTSCQNTLLHDVTGFQTVLQSAHRVRPCYTVFNPL